MRTALVIGINNYPNSKLNGCINDAKAIAELLSTHEDGNPNFDVNLKQDIMTRAELRAHISQLFNKESDLSLLYFAGHGCVTELGGYIMTPDYKAFDEGVSLNEILHMANNSKAKEKFIFLDSCHAGIMGKHSLMGGGVSILQSGTTILTSCLENETALEYNGHGIFTNLLIEALKGGAADIVGNITAGNIYAYADRALGSWSQRPVFKTNISKFYSLRNVKPLIERDKLRLITTYFKDGISPYPLDPSYEFTNKDIAIKKNVEIFQTLQKMNSLGLVVPVDEQFMFFAAQNSKACKLTALGYHYWNLVKNNRL